MDCICRALLALSIATGVAVPLHAQTGGHSYGVLAGLSLSKAGGSDVGGESKLVTGTAVGAYFTLAVGRRLAIEPQLLMVEKGIKSEEGELTATLKLSYLQLPLLAKLRFPMDPEGRTTAFLFAGPGVAYRIGCRLKLAQAGNELNAGCDTDEEADAIRSFDSSLIFGVGGDFGRTTASLRYDLGLSRLDQSADANDIKNRALILLVGIKVGMNR